MSYRLNFISWQNPNNIDVTGYHPDYYASQANVAYPGKYTTREQAEIAADNMAIPDQYGVVPVLSVEVVDNEDNPPPTGEEE